MDSTGEDFVKDFDNYMAKILGSSKAMRLNKQAAKMRKLRGELSRGLVRAYTKEEEEEFKKRVDRTQRQIMERRRKKTTFDQALAIARKLR